MRRKQHTPSGSAVHAETPGSPDAAAGQTATGGFAEAIAAAGRSLPELACWILPAALLLQLGEGNAADRLSAALFLLILFFGGISVIGKARAAAGTTLLLAALIVAISRVKAQYLGVPLMFNDFIYLTGESLRVTALQYKAPAAAAAAAFLAVLAGIAWLAWRPEPRVSLVGRGAGLVIVGVLSLHLPDAAKQAMLWDPLGQHARGALGAFANSLTKWAVSGSDKVTFADVGAAPLGGEIAATAQVPPAAGGRHPNIVLVLEESVFDPGTLGLPVEDGIADHFAPPDGVSGALNVSVFGGSTWVSEFSAVTGLDSRSFGEQAYYLPVLMEGRVHHSLITLLKSRGYRTVVVYCVGGRFMNAEASYRSLGADVFDAAVMDDEPGVIWVRRDRDFYQRALDHISDIRRESDRPVLALVVTIYNHGPHGAADYLEGRHPEVRSWLARAAPGRDMAPYRDYYLRLQDVMADRKWLRDEIARRFPDEPFVVASYGDHQPQFTADLADPAGADGARARYRTSFAIEGINRKLAPVPDWGDDGLDIAYLPAVLLTAAGLEPDRIFAARLELMQRCKGSYDGCDDQLKGRLHRTLIEEKLVEVDLTLPAEPAETARADRPPGHVEFAGRPH